MKYGVRYPRSGVHECPFGILQTQQIEYLAIINGVYGAKLVESEDGRHWREI
ncbi:hypothetical protein SEA_KERBEROS_67 [Mycobacterium phage Kerberos]|nr:hypothetical protein SEA_KERBEROS_67 [Mycobacterium phage Kerberos]